MQKVDDQSRATRHTLTRADPHLVTDTKITTIIFDMDGVLIDSEPAHKLAKERAFAKLGIVLPEAV